jgi:WD40-like Beta Propeller Repeat
MTTKLISSVLFIGLASVAAAQTPTAGPRWSAYAGCWEPVVAEGQPLPSSTPRVCVVPSSGVGADLISVVDKKVTDRMHIEADGAHHDVKQQGCAGWESAAWSSDGRRLYFNSDQKCDAVDAAGRPITVDVVAAGLQRKASGIFAVGSDGRWTNIVNVSSSGGHGLRVLRYAPVLIDSTYPSEIFTVLGNRDMYLSTARIAARSRIKLDDVIDASKSLEPAVVDAWLAASEQRFDLDAKGLVRLADAGVAPETIDVMVAVSNPGVFAVASNGGGVSASAMEIASQSDRANRNECLLPIMDPWGYSDYRSCDPYRRYGYYGGAAYGYDPFYSLYGSPYGAGYGYGFGSGYNGYGYSGIPVVVIVRGSANDPLAKHGHMTKDGYTTQAPSTASGATQSSAGSGAATSSSSGSTSSGSSSSGRTAHAKPPAE